jgi:hypothetical protein
MTHRLRPRHPLNAIGHNPLIVSLRYRCECATNEVLQISMVLDMDTSEEAFVMTVREMWRDAKFEVEQHLNPPQVVPAPGAAPSSPAPQTGVLADGRSRIGMVRVTAAEIDAAKTERGGWSQATLAKWGVPWPPPRGWRAALIEGKPIDPSKV